MSTRAVAFLATREPERALRFYRDVIGLPLIEETAFAIVFDAFGTQLRVQIVESFARAPYTAFGLQVDDIAREVRALAAKGVSGVRYPHLPQDELGIWTAPTGARVFWFHEPDENLISLSQG